MNKCFCIHCGTKNYTYQKRCMKCHELLKPKDESYVKLVKDKFIGKGTDAIFEKTTTLISGYIKSHLYSTVLLVTIVATAVIPPIIVNNEDHHKDEIIVTERPTIIDNEVIDIPVVEVTEPETTTTTTTTTTTRTNDERTTTTTTTTTTTRATTTTTTTTGIIIPSAAINLTSSRGGTIAVLDAVMRNDNTINNKVKYTSNFSDSQRMVNGYLQCYQAYNSSGTVVDSLTNKMGSFDIKSNYARILNLNLPSLTLENDQAIKDALSVECYYGSVGESVPLVQESLDAGLTDIAAYYVQINPCKDTECSNVNTPSKETSRNIFVVILGKRSGKWYYITTSSHVPKDITYSDSNFYYYVLGNLYTYEQAKTKYNF